MRGWHYRLVSRFEDNQLAVAVQGSSIIAGDGTRLALRQWPAPDGASRGTVLIVHGLGEHSGRYEHVAARLRFRGFLPVAYDHRGHGRSEGSRGVLRNRDDFVQDLAKVVDAVRPTDGTPFTLLGHSMGGLIVAQFVADAVRPVDALVMSSPALAADLTGWQRMQLILSLAFVPNLAIPNGFDPSVISHDPAVVRAYKEDPLVHDRVSGRLVRTLMEGGAHVLSRASSWKVPTLLIWAGDDHLVLPAGSATFAALAPAGVVEAHRFPDAYHEIFNELDAEPVFATLERWLDSRFAVARR